MKKLVYDPYLIWPYFQAYGMVPAPKVKKPRKPRKSRALPASVKQQRKLQRELRTQRGLAWAKANPTVKETIDGAPRKRRKAKDKHVEQAHAEVWASPLLENPPQGFQETFVSCAMRECEE